MNGYTNQYLENQVNSASPEQILILLYDGAVRFSALAIQSIEQGDIEKRSYYVNKASAIIAELAASLNHDIGAHIAEDLDALYNYMLKELMEATVSNDKEPIERVKTMLGELRETWIQAIEINNQEKEACRLSNPPTRYKWCKMSDLPQIQSQEQYDAVEKARIDAYRSLLEKLRQFVAEHYTSSIDQLKKYEENVLPQENVCKAFDQTLEKSNFNGRLADSDVNRALRAVIEEIQEVNIRATKKIQSSMAVASDEIKKIGKSLPAISSYALNQPKAVKRPGITRKA